MDGLAEETTALPSGGKSPLPQARVDYQALFERMLDGCALHEMIFDADGKPRDYRFLAVNPAFERLTGLSAKDILGKTVLEVMPGTEPFWIETYGRVVLTGEPCRFEHYAHELKKHFEVVAFRSTRGRFAVVFEDITERKQLHEAIRDISLKDELTGLHNRRGFVTLAEQQLKLANRGKHTIVLLYADMDNLKLVNDRFGHPTGDRLIREAAVLLQKAYRDSDILARIGGDEFVVLMVETSGIRPPGILLRLQRHVEERNRASPAPHLSISAGLARYDGANPCSLDELLVQADRLMYEQKRRKRAQNR